MLIGPFCIVVLLASVLTGSDRLAFRDVSYFYTPLYDYVAKRCAGQPWGVIGSAIWNPLDLMGMPLAGETTTAVFYPVRMLVYAPKWTAETSMGVYVVVHLIVASLSAYWLARIYRCRPWSAAIAGIVYPLSGTVLFLATNPPFLVSAAWLPMLMGSLLRPQDAQGTGEGGWEARFQSALRGVPLASVAMAMMILGGDPSTAFHAVLILSLVSLSKVIAWCMVKRNGKRRGDGSLMARTIATCVIASGLSVPQIAASLDWSRQSDRMSKTTHDEVRRSNAFAFSFPTWRVAEFGIPNLFGAPWPIHHRWDRLVFDPGGQRPENALWTPTVYIGASFWIFMSMSIMRRGRNGFKRTWSRWLRSEQTVDWWVIGVVALLASMGSYTPLYGWMLDWIPGYDSLRYPSKWLPFVTLALALGFARRSQSLGHWPPPRVNRSTTRAIPWSRLSFVGIFVLPVIVLISLGMRLDRLPQQIGAADYYWGPFQPDLAKAAYWSACCHLCVVTAGLGCLLWYLMRAESSLVRKRWTSLLVIVVALDLVIAHRNLVPRIDRAEERQRIQASPEFPRGLRWMNTLPRGGAPSRWQSVSSDDRMLEVEATLRSSWFGRWHLEKGQAKFNSLVSIRPAPVAEFWAMTRRATANQPAQERRRRWELWMSDLNIVGSIVRQDDQIQWDPTKRSLVSKEQAMVGLERFIEVHADQSTMIRRAVYQDGNWTATAVAIGSANSAPIQLPVRSQGSLSQSIQVPAGDWRIQWKYSPWWLVPSTSIWLVTWLLLLAGYGFRETFWTPTKKRTIDKTKPSEEMITIG